MFKNPVNFKDGFIESDILKMGFDFTRRQWLTIIVISIADFCNAICVALQAPFYPQEVSDLVFFL